jgi:hypothetical protein
MPRADGSTSRSGPSGPTIPADQRKRKPTNLTLSDVARAALDAEVARTEETRSALVEALILTGTPDGYLSPALLEQVQALAAERGETVHAALHSAVEVWMAGIERLSPEERERWRRGGDDD